MKSRAVTIELSRAQVDELREALCLERGPLTGPALLRAVGSLKASLAAAADGELRSMTRPDWKPGRRTNTASGIGNRSPKHAKAVAAAYSDT